MFLPLRADDLRLLALSRASTDAVACPRRLHSGDGRDKAVAAPRHGLDAAAVRVVLIEDTPQRRNLDRQVIIFDYDARPRSGHDLVARDEIARPLQQHAEHVERARAGFYGNQSGFFISPEQAAPIETEPIELENPGRGEHCHGLRLPCISPLGRILAQFRVF